jgi:Spy/CpxP family protein refolding chaperone
MKRRWFGIAGISAAALSILAAGAAAARHRGGCHDPERMKSRVMGHLEDALDDEDQPLSDGQKQAVEALLDRVSKSLADNRLHRREVRDQALGLFTAERFDDSAARALEAEQLARAKLMADEIVTGLADLHEVLTPKQRHALAAEIRERTDRFQD